MRAVSGEDSQDTGGLSPQYHTYERQKCFIAYTEQAQWSDDLLSACREVLSRPEFNLEPDYARKHFYPDVPLRQKALELIANARYGIYDLSYWRDEKGKWQMPRNVFIELGMAIAFNRPTLLLRHANNRELELPECLKSVKGHILEFSGETTLERVLEERLPQWVNAPPDRDWWNRYCIFGGRTCEHRKAHPRAKQWGQKTLRCHISDSPDVDRDDFRAVIEEVLGRFSNVTFDYLDALSLTKGYDFLLCTHCQTVRSTPFAIYRITPRTLAETCVAVGMSIALESQFEYKIPKILFVEDVHTIPSLLSGYEVVVARNDTERKSHLRTFMPTVIQKVQETAWEPRPLPFVEMTYAVEFLPQDLERPRQPYTTYQGPREALDWICAEPDQNLLLNIYGEAGIGKSRLLHEAAQRLQAKSTPALVLQVDLKLLTGASANRPERLLRALIAQSEGRLSSVWQSQSMEQVAGLVVAQLTEIAHRVPVYLMFDTTEVFQEDMGFWHWMEGDLVGPLAIGGQVRLVFAGRAPVPWRRLEVRRRVRLLSLEPLSPQEGAKSLIREVLQQHNPRLEEDEILEQAVNLILEFSFGHPLLSKSLANYAALRWPMPSLSEFRLELCRETVEPFIEQYLFEGIAPPWNEILWWASVLDGFDAIILQRYLEQVAPELIEGKSDFFFIQGITNLRIRNTVVWLDELGNHLQGVIADIVRRCFETLYPERYQRACRAAAETVENLGNELPDGDPEAQRYRQEAEKYRQRATSIASTRRGLPRAPLESGLRTDESGQF
jgi:hypothetical protein